MIHLKTDEEIKIMKKGGDILKEVMKELKPTVKPGITTNDIDQMAQKLIKAHGGDISFNKVPGYSWATCLTIDDQVVHTPPSKRVIKNGDVLTIDIGVYYKGFHVDYSTTFVVGTSTNKETEKFLKIGEETLYKAIKAAQVGHHLGEISEIIENEIEGHGYHVMYDLTGHGVGHELHEDPLIPGYVDRPIKKTKKIENGMVIAIEVIYSMGTHEIEEEKGDSWSLVTDDGSLSACFEHTIAISQNKSFILT